MPCLRIETTQGWLEGSSEALFDRIDAVLCRVLKVPPDDSLIRLNEYPREKMRLPAKSGQRYVFIEVALFAGRSLETKRALYDGLTQVMADFGAAAGDVTIALHEVALENWGIEGGKPASDIAFGFTIAI
ncbi:MAG TPA: tautomerase family protein [Novimethylophilus sp.]|jgi:4-oxalocrotonate tautomerase family enzyme|uniref:tautomerase family protein n=1 Tax=Novimethylophilus sp. TaxID=2137426 RepID=UPI002F3EB335